MGRPLQVTDGHLARRALGYCRQSSGAQVRDNTGSTEIQRDVLTVAREFGWPEELIELRDGDLGSSADEPGSREEFNELIAEMQTGRVGAVFATESSRMSRNEVDAAIFAHWARLYDVLLVVGSQVFDFKDPNSAFIAGIMGLNAVRENRTRAKFGQEAKRRKAAQGLSPSAPPVGIVRTPGGGWDLDPDDRVQEAIQIVFEKIFEIRSATGLVRYLRQLGIQLPRRMSRGGRRWADATQSTVLAILKNPVYAGTYIYGKRTVDPTRTPFKSGQRRSRLLPPHDWITVENHHKGYIALHRWAEIQEILAQNRLTLGGPPGRGEALLQGVMICAVHQVKLLTVYTARERLADGSVRRGGRYHCRPGRHAGEQANCCTIRSGRLDVAIEAELLKTLVPPSLEAMRDAAREAVRQHEAIVRAREDELRRAEREVARLEDEFLNTDANLRSIKERLGRLWEAACQRHADLTQRHRLHPVVQPLQFEEAEVAELRQMLADLPSLWRHPNVTPQQRKTILKLVIKAIYVTPGPEVWKLEVEWVGGARSRHDVLTRKGVEVVAKRESFSHRSPEEICQRLAALGAVRGVGIRHTELYDIEAVRHVIRRVRDTKPYGAKILSAEENL